VCREILFSATEISRAVTRNLVLPR
jgi:hypothetical protein